MSQEQKPALAKSPPGVYRSGLEAIPGGGKEHFADSLSTVDPKHLHARTRIPAVFSMAVHSLLSKSVRREREFTNPQGVVFDMHTLSGRMECFQFEYEAIAISGGDGKGRQEIVDVMKLAAIGGGDESGAIATSVLNEGSKNLSSKASKSS